MALPEDVLKSLMSRSCDSKEVVFQFKEALQLDESALKKPDIQTKRKIRCLARQAKCSDRSDVIKQLRDMTPAGTTGESRVCHVISLRKRYSNQMSFRTLASRSV